MTDPVSREERPRIAVLTAVSGEHAHLLNHVDGLTLSSWPPDIHVVTSVSDRELSRGRLPIHSDRWETVVPKMPWARTQPAFSAALELAARHALAAEAEVLVYLSAHCIPGHRLIQAFAEHATAEQGSAPTLWHSETSPLAPAPPIGYPVAGDLTPLVSDEHPARPRGLTDGPDPRWSDSFAMTAHDWRAMVSAGALPDGGDLTTTVTACGGWVRQVPGVTAYCQHPSGRSLTFRGSPQGTSLGEPA
jgi:hypothetical protein